MQSFELMEQTANSIKEEIEESLVKLCNISLGFWWCIHTHTVCVPPAPANMQCFGLRRANWVSPTFDRFSSSAFFNHFS